MSMCVGGGGQGSQGLYSHVSEEGGGQSRAVLLDFGPPAGGTFLVVAEIVCKTLLC